MSGVPAGATRVVLVRHGETDYNRQGRWQGSGSDVPLNETGRTQARALARALAGCPLEALYTSDLVRAVETAAIIAETTGLEPLTEPALREMSHGRWEGRTRDEVLLAWAAEHAAFEADPWSVRRPGGDSYGDLARRLWPALDRIARDHRGARVVAVTHGGPIRLVLARVLDRPLTERAAFGVENASRFTVEASGGDWRLVE